MKTGHNTPNIVLFLVDDMGWQDTSLPFHSERTPLNDKFHTPNMERLAASGMKFTQSYACAVCSPTRVSLLTGQNAARHRVTNWTLMRDQYTDGRQDALEFPKWNINGLTETPDVPHTVQAKCLPSYLKDAGYRSIHIGKAHFGAEGTPGEDPLNLGFDINIGGHAAGGPGSYLSEQGYSAQFRGETPIWDVPGLDAYHNTGTFLTEALTREANREVKQAIEDDMPFFLYMSHYAVHVPFAEDPRFIQRYLDAGLDHTEAMYAALVEGMDKSLGDILDVLEAQGVADNTVVLFMSDNGGLSAHLRGGELHTHNKPLSSGKGSAHEGGIRVPMIARWPNVTNPNSICHDPVIIEDFFATILDIAGVQRPDNIDGRSFIPLLNGVPEINHERPLIWHFPNFWCGGGPGLGAYSSIRQGDWKLIYYHDPKKAERFELFKLTEDLGESNNLASHEPEKVAELSEVLTQKLMDSNAQMPTIISTGNQVPYPNEKEEGQPVHFNIGRE